MISLIEARNFRSLQYVRQPLGPFHVLVGPNASGKTTFLDVISFLGKLMSDGLEKAVRSRTSNFRDLLFQHTGDSFDLAVELTLPEDRKPKPKNGFNTIRYEISIGLDEKSERIGIREEKAWLVHRRQPRTQLRDPMGNAEELVRQPTVITAKAPPGWKGIITSRPPGVAFFEPEERSDGATLQFSLGKFKSALANLPEDESKFPAATWLKDVLREQVQTYVFNSRRIRRASIPDQGKRLKADGSNLPWVIATLEHPKNNERFKWWLEHLQTALPDLEMIRTVERPDDRHRYLMLRYRDGLEVPSWMVSDGTLRLLALTIPAYLPHFRGVCLVEEPENGIHPKAVETVFESLSSIYKAQVLLATHSPVILSVADLKQVLCFTKTPAGATHIVSGKNLPALRKWKGEENLGVLFAGGVLG